MLSLVCGISKNGTNELIYKTEIESQMQKTILQLPGDAMYFKEMKTIDSSLSSFQKYKWWIKYDQNLNQVVFEVQQKDSHF